MRIIGGVAKGKALRTPNDGQRGGKKQKIRPTADKAREALFSILGDSVRGASMLDLFAGTGAMGIEAMSRGAKAALFVDNNPVALALIKENIITTLADSVCSGEQIARVMEHNLKKGLPDFSLLPKELQQFDIIIADPPYSKTNNKNQSQNGKGLARATLTMLVNNTMIQKSNPLLIVEERSTASMPGSLGEFIRSDIRVYGEAAFHFYLIN